MAAMNVAPQLEVVPSTGSTSSDLLARPWLAPNSGASLLALEQTAGRGRRGRSWLAQGEASLCMSVSQDIVDTDGQISMRLPGLSLAIGVAAAQALESAFPHRIAAGSLGLKWPNDLVLIGPPAQGATPRKCGGILIEVRHQAPQVRIVVGIGINLVLTQAQPAEASALPIGALFEASSAPDRVRLATHLASVLHSVVHRCAQEGWEHWRAGFEARNVLQGKHVHFVQSDVHCDSGPAVVMGVAADGALLVRTAGQEIMSVHAGEVSVRASDWERRLHV
jgi:BirA family transcriptional regulator, biotin operon repressor / biotin---[acetyl-CoA-carboxylase] ligase